MILFKTQSDEVQSDGKPPNEGEMWVNTKEKAVKILLDGQVVSLFNFAGVPKQIESRLLAVEEKTNILFDVAVIK